MEAKYKQEQGRSKHLFELDFSLIELPSAF